MINWDDLKHIHVIRKLQQVLSQWFDTEIFFVDERGQVRNLDWTANAFDYRNPLASSFLGREKGREILLQHIAEANEQIFQGDAPHSVIKGPAGFENAFVSKMAPEGEFLGSVYAYCFVDKEVSESVRLDARGRAQGWGLDGELFQHSIARLKVLTEGEKRYFFELVDLVAQEIVTFHSEITKREERISALSSELSNRHTYASMVGKSKPMQDTYGLLEKIKASDSTVLIQGENGTGKELIAKAIHFNSPRKDGAFITVNCSAFNENLLDSELFGHVRGSFTGAVKDKKGLFEAAHNGTLFLDEIGDMTLTMQVKLLRVLQEGTLIPVGGTEQRKVDVRVIAATNRDLKDMVENGLFREDLFYRINVINVEVPSLRDRKEDIPLLVDHFLLKFCKEKGVAVKSLAKRTMEKVYDYPWPGNIRQLQNEMERLVVLAGEESRIPVELLSQPVKDWGNAGKGNGVRVTGKLKDALEELEKTMIREGLKRCRWNKSRLAKELGISRAGLIMKIEKYDLDKRLYAIKKGA